MPTAAAATDTRKVSSVRMASPNPAPTSPTRVARAPSSSSRPSGCGAIGSCRTTVTPGCASSTQNAVRPLRPSAGSTVANTVATSARPRLEMNIFSPVRR